MNNICNRFHRLQTKENIMIENRLLNYFLVVAREQNMTKAAVQLHITQSTLSKQISDLEKQLGIQLFKRTNKNTYLTEDGMRFRTKAQEMIELMNKMEAEFTYSDGNISGEVYIGCGETYIMRKICKILKRIQIEYPQIHFNLFSGESTTIYERLDKGLLDIGLLLGPIKEEKFIYQKLNLSDTFGLLVPTDSEIAKKEYVTIEEISSLPLIVPIQEHDTDLFPQFTNKVGTYNLINNATYMLEERLGYVFCIDKLVNIEGRNIKFIPIKPTISIDSYITTKKYAYLSKVAKLVLDEIIKELGE